jgi:general nucleoside transport system ATP-binding protein
VLDNLLLGRRGGFFLKRHAQQTRITKLAEKYGLTVPFERMTGELSVGDRQRVEILKCLVGDPKLLLLDEPTAVLPPSEVDGLIATIRRIADAGKAVIMVTHKLAEIERVADHVTVLRHGQVAASARMHSIDMRSLVRAMVGRDVGTLDASMAASIGIDEPPQAMPTQTTSSVDPPRREDALVIDGISVTDRQTGAVRLNKLTLVVPRGQIVGLAGVDGNGQTELGLVLAGLLQPASGRFFVGDTELTGRSPAQITAAGVGIIPEDRHAVGCISAMSIADNLFLGRLNNFSSRFGVLQRLPMTNAADELVRQFDVRGGTSDQPMSSLSGGNQQKLVLARELSVDPLKFVLAAQPTRGLDVGAVEAVYGRLRAVCRDRGAGVLLISSELDELLAVADRIAVVYRGEIVGELPRERFSREVLGALMSGHHVS